MSFLIPTPGGGKDSSLRLVNMHIRKEAWEILSAEKRSGRTLWRGERQGKGASWILFMVFLKDKMR